jgi:uncharacterized membrane protein
MVAPADLLGSDLDSMATRRGRALTNHPGAFVYRKGRYTPLDSLAGLTTAHLGTNDRGRIVGAYPLGGATILRGFLGDQRGDYTSSDATSDAFGTFPFDINDRGTAVGGYADARIDVHGFLRRPNGTVTIVDVPGAQSIVASGINNRGAVVGTFIDGKGPHGFLLDRGKLTAIDPPDANPTDVNNDPLGANVSAFDINDRGQIVGFYPAAHGTFHGYLDEGALYQDRPARRLREHTHRGVRRDGKSSGPTRAHHVMAPRRPSRGPDWLSAPC